MKQTVEEASIDYAIGKTHYRRNVLKEVDIDDYSLRKNDCYEDFKAGAEWQSKQSPWISVNQYPPMDKPLLLKYGDGGIDDMDLGFYTELHYLTKDGQEVDKHVIEWMVL